MADRPTLLDVLDAHAKRGAGDTRGPQPGRVRAYADGVADVEPLVLPADGLAPVLRGVAVLWPWGVDGDLAAGDLVLLVPCERDLSRWRSDPDRAQVAPSARRNALADCVALPVWQPGTAQAVAMAAAVDTLMGRIAAWALAVQGATGVTPPNLAGSVAGGIRVRP